MPIRYERDDSRRRVVVTMDGPFDTADFRAVSEQHGADTWSYGTLFDLRGMTGKPTITDLRQIMNDSAVRQPVKAHPVPSRSSPPDPTLYGSACTYAALRRATLAIEVFRDLDKAEAGLSTQLNG